MTDLAHLNSIELRLSHERVRAEEAKSGEEKTWREHNVRMIEKERADEIAFLASKGIDAKSSEAEMSDSDLLAALVA